jgi:hypothetical protein
MINGPALEYNRNGNLIKNEYSHKQQKYGLNHDLIGLDAKSVIEGEDFNSIKLLRNIAGSINNEEELPNHKKILVHCAVEISISLVRYLATARRRDEHSIVEARLRMFEQREDSLRSGSSYTACTGEVRSKQQFQF